MCELFLATFVCFRMDLTLFIDLFSHSFDTYKPEPTHQGQNAALMFAEAPHKPLPLPGVLLTPKVVHMLPPPPPKQVQLAPLCTWL